MVHSGFSHCIANISRESLRETTNPSKWKVGKVTTLFKTGEREVCADYRPLTLLSIPSKITESVICESLDPYLRRVLQRNQWGYRKGLSSESLLLYLTEMWKLFIDNGKVIGAIFVDCRKAFDSVDHNILGYKLQACVITGSL